jgi:pilus assembly protein CpaC
MLNYNSKKTYINLLSLFSIIVALFFCCTSIQAQDLYDEETISLLVGQIKIMSVDSPTRVSVASPQIVDISSVAEKEIILVGKSQGNTTLTIWDKQGEKSFIVRVFSEDLNRLKQEIDGLLNKLEITTVNSQVNEDQAKVILMGKIQEEKKDLFDKAIKSYEKGIINLVSADEKNPLVLIDVEILEIGKNDLDQLGINWSTAMQFREEPYSSGTTTTTGGVTTSFSKTGTLSELIRITDWSRDALTFKLNFLKTEGRARTLSRPKLVCISGKSAELLIGGEIPIVQTTTTITTTTAAVQFKKYGIKLNIEPKVRNNEEINIKLATEISDVDWARTVTTNYGTYPSFTNRSASTELYLKEGQTIFIAGLLKNMDAKNINKVPALGEIPILGALFRSKRFQLDQTELVISLTPTIMKERPPEQPEESKIPYEVPPGPPEPSVTKEIPQDPLSQYAYAIQKKISQAAVYPKIAEESRWEGEVRLSLHVLGDGNLDDVLLIKPSGINLLDETAIALVKNQAPFPAFPAEIKEKDLWIDVSLVYQPE